MLQIAELNVADSLKIPELNVADGELNVADSGRYIKYKKIDRYNIYLIYLSIGNLK